MIEGANDNLGRLFNAPDAGAQGPGDRIRLAREAQRIPIEVMASNIKVSVGKLQALESGRFAELPDANFTRALAMTVCRALKIDPTEVLAGLPAAKLSALTSDTPSLNQPFKQSRSGVRLFDSSVDWAAFLRPQWLAPVGLLVAAVVLYAVPGSAEWPSKVGAWFATQPNAAKEGAEASASGASEPELPVATGIPEDLASAPAASAAVAGAASAALAASTVAGGVPTLQLDPASSTRTGAEAATQPSLPNAASPASPAPVAATVPAAPEAPPAPSVSAPGNALVNLRASEASWIEVRDGEGKRVLSRLLHRDESLDLSAQPPLSLRVGNAKGVSLSYKGQPMDLVPYTRNNVARFELK